ncbi:MAG: hypothetical protein HQ549_01220, partial [Candidatus Omnitrophica bacterium]|nr:hypothetical protein [Candidatus Omnitrophota bacterium]
MMWPHKLRIVFKTISACIAGIFLWNQIAWAGDFINVALEEAAVEQTQMFAPEYLQNQQAVQENLISKQKDIENALATFTQNDLTAAEPEEEASLELQGPNGAIEISQTPIGNEPAVEGEGDPPTEDTVFSITTQDGDIIYYRDNAIERVEKADGTIIRDIVLDDAGQLLDAIIEYTDGTIQILEAGKVTRIITPDETIFNYCTEGVYEGLIASVVYSDGTVVTYSYTLDAEDNVLETVLTDAEKTCYYDSEGLLKKVEFNTGKTIEYTGGVLSSATDENGIRYIYEEVEEIQEGNTVYVVKLKEIMDNQGNTFYLEGNKVICSDGTLYKYEPREGTNIEVYKMLSYNYLNCYQSYYSDQNISYTLNPSLKATFNLDSQKTYSSLYMSAYYYDRND